MAKYWKGNQVIWSHCLRWSVEEDRMGENIEKSNKTFAVVDLRGLFGSMEANGEI